MTLKRPGGGRPQFPLHPANRHASVVDPPANPAGAVQHLEYNIFDGDVGDPQSDVPNEIVEQVAEAMDLIYDGKGAEAVRRLEPLLERYPNVPRLYNLLRTAYVLAGQRTKASEIAERNYRLHPTYLFAKLDYAGDFLTRGQPQKVAEILENKFDLKLLYPHRDAFHISELIGLLTLVAEYHLAIGDLNFAMRCGDVLDQVAPDHPAVEALLDRMALFALTRAIDRLPTGRRAPAKRRRKRKGRGAQG